MVVKKKTSNDKQIYGLILGQTTVHPTTPHACIYDRQTDRWMEHSAHRIQRAAYKNNIGAE